MIEYAIARPVEANIQARIKAAVIAFYQGHRALPAAVIVHASEVEPARAALATLGLRLPVRDNGGCLLPEVWLEVPNA